MPIVDMKMIVLRIISPIEKIGHPSLKIEISKYILSKAITEIMHKQETENTIFLVKLNVFKNFEIILLEFKNVSFCYFKIQQAIFGSPKVFQYYGYR